MINQQSIPLAELHISKLNMRHSRRKPFIADILPSIREKGLRQPLLVRKEGKSYGVVAGRRRWFSLKEVQKSQEQPLDVPCAIMGDGDDADALEASLIENLARLDPDEMQQYEAFKALADQDRTVPEIASLFGITELTVKRRLAIGGLLPEIRQLYRDDEIRSDTLMALTLASESQQKDWLNLWHDETQAAPHGAQLKAWVLGGGEIDTRHALFDLKTYEGQVYEDLFGECAVFADADLFWQHQNDAVAALRTKFLESGWTHVTIMERGSYFTQWEYLKTSKKEDGEIFIETRHTGEVVIHKGFKKPARAKASGKTTDKPELSRLLENYIDLHRHAAVRMALLGNQHMALRLLAAQLIAGSDLIAALPDPQKAVKEEIAPSIDASPAQARFVEIRAEIATLLGIDTEGPITGGNRDPWSLCQLFQRCLELSDVDVNRILTFIMVESLQAGHLATDLVGTLLGVDMKEAWQLDDTFFALIRDKQLITAMVEDVAGKKVADANAAETAKVQKKILTDCVNGTDGRAAKSDWVPKWMQFPSASYLPKRPSGLASRAVHIRELIDG